MKILEIHDNDSILSQFISQASMFEENNNSRECINSTLISCILPSAFDQIQIFFWQHKQWTNTS